MSHAAQRTAFLNTLDVELDRDPDSVVVFRIDLDRFPRIRQTFGGTTSRLVRGEVVSRIEEFVHPQGALLTYGEDSFAGLVRVGNANHDELEDLGMAIIRSVSAPVEVPGNPPIAVGSNVGIAAGALFSQPNALRLLTGAELAIQRANALGSRRTIIYRAAPEDDPTRLPHLFEDMLGAIADEQFVPWFQPVVALTDRSIVGAESLIRWVHPDHGTIGPAEFIPEAEKSGLIRDIDAMVWQHAAQVFSTLPVQQDLALSVNISPADLDFPELISVVKDCIVRSRLAPERMIFEVTETALSQDWSRARRRLEALKDLGTQIAVDDFGTGHMFLDRLSTGLFDILKVDRSLIAPEEEPTERADALLAGVVSLARNLGMTVVAEGIETEQQLQRAQVAGCDRGQGYLFSRPLPEAEYLALIRRGTGL